MIEPFKGPAIIISLGVLYKQGWTKQTNVNAFIFPAVVVLRSNNLCKHFAINYCQQEMLWCIVPTRLLCMVRYFPFPFF